jgi:hypothetical protein
LDQPLVDPNYGWGTEICDPEGEDPCFLAGELTPGYVDLVVSGNRFYGDVFLDGSFFCSRYGCFFSRDPSREISGWDLTDPFDGLGVTASLALSILRGFISIDLGDQFQFEGSIAYALQEIPLPAAFWLFVAGLVGLASIRVQRLDAN